MSKHIDQAAERRADYVRALKEEREGYLRAGKPERVKAVDAELERVTGVATRSAPEPATAEPRRAKKA